MYYVYAVCKVGEQLQQIKRTPSNETCSLKTAIEWAKEMYNTPLDEFIVIATEVREVTQYGNVLCRWRSS